MGVIKIAGDYIKNGEVEMIGKTEGQILVKVGEHIVNLKRSAGKIIDSCSCANHAKFNQLNPRCSHKLAAETYLVMRSIE